MDEWKIRGEGSLEKLHDEVETRNVTSRLFSYDDMISNGLRLYIGVTIYILFHPILPS